MPMSILLPGSFIDPPHVSPRMTGKSLPFTSHILSLALPLSSRVSRSVSGGRACPDLPEGRDQCEAIPSAPFLPANRAPLIPPLRGRKCRSGRDDKKRLSPQTPMTAVNLSHSKLAAERKHTTLTQKKEEW